MGDKLYQASRQKLCGASYAMIGRVLSEFPPPGRVVICRAHWNDLRALLLAISSVMYSHPAGLLAGNLALYSLSIANATGQKARTDILLYSCPSVNLDGK